ncbi:MAG: hypothetical protein WBC59_10365 [Phycisphaerae bacterium]
MSERIRTLLAVVVLTATIWVWADLEQHREEQLTVAVKVEAPDDYDVRDLFPKSLTVEVRGPKGEIEKLRASKKDLECRIAPTGPELKTGRVVLRAEDGFHHWHAYRVEIVKITDDDDRVKDGEIVVDLDRKVRKPVPVKVVVTGATVEGKPAVDPPEVIAVVRESALANLAEAKHFAVALLAIETIPEDRQIKDRPVDLEPRLGGADGIEATFEPKTVNVTVTLESAVVEKTLERIPIQIAGPPEMLNIYQVIFQEDADRWIDLKVSGPRRLVDLLTARDVRVALVLTPEDRPAEGGTWIPRVPEVLGLPPGVEIDEPVPTLNFNLKRRREEAAGS